MHENVEPFKQITSRPLIIPNLQSLVNEKKGIEESAEKTVLSSDKIEKPIEKLIEKPKLLIKDEPPKLEEPIKGMI